MRMSIHEAIALFCQENDNVLTVGIVDEDSFIAYLSAENPHIPAMFEGFNVTLSVVGSAIPA